MPTRVALPAPGASLPFFADFPALAAYLDKLGLFRMRPGMERIATVLHTLGLTRPSFIVVQVVGTNGKGSTSTMLAALAQAHGLRTGLCTSPHFVSPRERVRLDGRTLPEEEWIALANALMQAGGHELTYFELVTALAVLAFARAPVDIAVMETGLGGTFDATTALAADMLLYTPIGLDHQAVLGNTLAAIAHDKAGAIRKNAPVFSAPQQPEAWAELVLAARERHAPLTLVEASFPLPEATLSGSRPLALGGPHQLGNARLALAGWRHLCAAHSLPCNRSCPVPRDFSSSIDGYTEGGRMLSDKKEEPLHSPVGTTAADDLEARALALAWHPGRMQHVPALPRAAYRGTASSAPPLFPCALGWPPLLLDGAHNAHGLAALGLALAQAGIAPAAVIFACLGDKDPARILPHLRALATGPIFVPPIAHNPRALPPEELAGLIGLAAVPVPSLRRALELAATHMAERLPEAFANVRPQNPLLICGSLYMLGEFFALRPDCLEAGK